MAAGKGFQMQKVYPEDDHVPVIRKHYNKGGSTDPYVVHPKDPELMRKFTVAEHALCKSIPPHLIGDVGATFGHEVLGQSINYLPFVGVGEMIGTQLLHPETVAAPEVITEEAPVMEAANSPIQMDLLDAA